MNETAKFSIPYWLAKSVEDRDSEFVIVLLANELPEKEFKEFKQLIQDHDVVIKTFSTSIKNNFVEFFVETSAPRAWELFQLLLIQAEKKKVDLAVLPAATRRKQLLICDMDSTIVASETLDDVAEQVGIGKQVSEITDRAMRGELDFRQALDERVGLLKGLSEEIFNELAGTIELNSGAETLLNVCKLHGMRTVLVSGGFEPIVKHVANRLGFDRYVCNRLEVSNERLSGKVMQPVVDASTKSNVLKEECQKMAITPEDACCLGDGANDLPMLEKAGLGIAYRGKPLLRDVVPYQINFSGLDSALMMMGIIE